MKVLAVCGIFIILSILLFVAIFQEDKTWKGNLKVLFQLWVLLTSIVLGVGVLFVCIYVLIK